MTSSTPHMLENIKKANIYNLEDNTRLLREALKVCPEEKLWEKTSENTNSIGSLVIHVCGNMKQWIIGPFTQTQFERDRAKEFTPQNISKIEVIDILNQTVDQVKSAIEGLEENQLTHIYEIQGFRKSGYEALHGSLIHYSQHVGQVVLLVKLFTSLDLKLYDHLNLNI